ncbi:MAG: hypothetical protein P4L92_14360 [Rudaea sp.]|nr:hypothetical protein [Rudaea sp.]
MLEPTFKAFKELTVAMATGNDKVLGFFEQPTTKAYTGFQADAAAQ